MTKEEATTAVIKNLLLNEERKDLHIGVEITEAPYAHFEAWGWWKGEKMIIEYRPRTWTR